MARAQPIFRVLIRACWLTGLAVCACRPAQESIFALAPAEPAESSSGTGAAAGSDAAGAGGAAGDRAGGAGNAGARALAGTSSMADPPLDPKVHFDWTDTPSPNAGPCGPGQFTGSFSCEVSSPVFAVLLYTHVEGSLRLTLNGTSEAARLTLEASELRAADNTAREFLVAPVNGALNCGTRVVDAEVPRTLTAILPIERQLFWALPYTQANATGWMRGNLEPRGLIINGDLSLALEDQTSCTGTFQVRASP
jgi:hypothetical protein